MLLQEEYLLFHVILPVTPLAGDPASQGYVHSKSFDQHHSAREGLQLLKATGWRGRASRSR